MDGAPPLDHKSLVLALSRARGRLQALRRSHLEGLEEAQRSLEDALAAVLREEERLWARARGERLRLQRQLAALQDANQRAGQAGSGRIQALRHQLGSLHSRLLAIAEASPPAAMAREVAQLLAQPACLALPVTWACFVPQPGAAAAALGELRLEERVLSMSPSRAEEGPAADSAAPQEGPPGLPLGGEPSSRAPQGALRSPGEEEEEEEETTRRQVRAPEAAAGALPLDPGTLFHARPVLVQDEPPDSEAGGGGDCRGVALLGSRVPSARAPSLPRWASAESLGRWRGGAAAVAGRRAGLGGSCLDLAPPRRPEAEARESSSWPGRFSPPRPAGSGRARRAPPGPARPRGWLSALPRSPRAAAPRPCDQLAGQWGRPGSRAGQFCLPHGLQGPAAASGALYVVDFGNRRLQALGGGGEREGGQVLPLPGKAYFDVALGRGGCLALSNVAGRCVELYSAAGVLLQTLREGFRSPRGVAASCRGAEFLVADPALGGVHVLALACSARGLPLGRCRTVLGFHKPYLVATNSRGEVAVSERGLDGGCCVKVLGPGWQVLRVLGALSRPPLLTNPWGVSLDEAGCVLVADWGRHSHTLLCYPPQGPGWAVATKGLSSPRGVALLGEQHVVVADSMHHCLKSFQYR